MTADYYPAELDKHGHWELLYPARANFSLAMAVHAERLMKQPPGRAYLSGPRRGQPIVPTPKVTALLDVGTLDPQNEEELHRLLLVDPVLHAIYQLGRQSGYLQAESEHAHDIGG